MPIVLRRQISPNRPKRTRISTAYGHVDVSIERGFEIVTTDSSGIARTLVAQHGFEVAEAPAPAPAPAEPEQPPQPPEGGAGDAPPPADPPAAPDAPTAPESGAETAPSPGPAFEPGPLAGAESKSIDEIDTLLAADGVTRENVLAAVDAENSREKPRKGALALYDAWLRDHQ